MAFPRTLHCIACEDARQEMGGKATILGFYGILPDVDILVSAFPGLLKQLTFMILAEPQLSTEDFDIIMRINDDAENEIARGESKVTLVGNPGRNVLMFGFMPLILPHAGKYEFVVKANGRFAYQGEFRAGQQVPTT